MTEHLILVIEDDLDQHFLYSRYFSKSGLQIESHFFTGIDKAIEFLDSTTKIPDLIITDKDVPPSSGFKMLEYIKSQKNLNECPAIMISGHLSQGEHQRALSLGAVEALIKPISSDKMHSDIQNIINRYLK